jgi:hypothetical protein
MFWSLMERRQMGLMRHSKFKHGNNINVIYSNLDTFINPLTVMNSSEATDRMNNVRETNCNAAWNA